jgi:hypothetical protein
MDERGELVEQIVRLLDIRLLDPLEVLLESDDVVDAVRRLVRIRAGQWADSLHAADDIAAVRTSARLVATLYPSDRAFDPPADWWRTPLGRTVARRVGHPSTEAVSYGTAGAMLGISRQGVHDLVRRGRLPRHPDGGVPSSAIRDRLRNAPGRLDVEHFDTGRLVVEHLDTGYHDLADAIDLAESEYPTIKHAGTAASTPRDATDGF